MNDLCKNCWKFEQFGKKCDYFWEKKTECSKFQKSEFEKEKFKVIE